MEETTGDFRLIGFERLRWEAVLVRKIFDVQHGMRAYRLKFRALRYPMVGDSSFFFEVVELSLGHVVCPRFRPKLVGHDLFLRGLA